MAIFDFPSRIAWQAAAAAFFLAYGMLFLLGVSVAVKPVLFMVSVICGLFCVAYVYTRWRPDATLAVTAMGAAWLLAMAGSGGVMTYPLAAVSGPLWDARFIAFERALGFDWQATAQALNPTPLVQWVWLLTYESSLAQMALCVLLLGFVGAHARLAAYLKMLLAALLAVDLLSALMLAIGPIRAYGIGADAARLLGDAGIRHLGDFFALREGHFGAFDLYKMEGIITFPSFHCVLAVLTAWALWPVRWIGVAAAAVNALVLISTVPQGGPSQSPASAQTPLSVPGQPAAFAPQQGNSTAPIPASFLAPTGQPQGIQSKINGAGGR